MPESFAIINRRRPYVEPHGPKVPTPWQWFGAVGLREPPTECEDVRLRRNASNRGR